MQLRRWLVRAEPGAHQSPVVAALWAARTRAGAAAGPPSRDLVPRAAADSATGVTYDFDTDPLLQDRYRSPWGTVRLGRIFEDLDALAGTIAFVHCLPHSPSLHIVTASVDRIQVHRRADIDRKMSMSGRVVWTGRSSMVIEMTASDSASGETLLGAGFTFVARDRGTGRPRFVNPVVPTTASDRAMFAAHTEQADRRRERRSAKGVAGAAVDALALELNERGRKCMLLPALAPADVLMIGATAQSNSFITQPQHRNTSDRIFGGFLMRRAFELAHSTAYCFCGAQPEFVEVDEVLFLSPVEIGNLVRLDACVLSTDGDAVHVEVIAKVTDPVAATSRDSNVFHFTFRSTGKAPLRGVLPQSRDEAARIAARVVAESEQARADSDAAAAAAAPKYAGSKSGAQWDPYR